MNIILQTPRLILRQFTVTDAALIQQLNSVPHVLKYIHEPALENIAQAEEVLINIILPQYKKTLAARPFTPNTTMNLSAGVD